MLVSTGVLYVNMLVRISVSEEEKGGEEEGMEEEEEGEEMVEEEEEEEEAGRRKRKEEGGGGRGVLIGSCAVVVMCTMKVCGCARQRCCMATVCNVHKKIRVITQTMLSYLHGQTKLGMVHVPVHAQTGTYRSERKVNPWVQ